MRYKQIFTRLLLAILSLTFMPAVSSAELLEKDSSVTVFRFQKKLAQRGNPQAQYNLARMYEYGNGVEKDLDQAILWYRKAATQDYTPAKHHLTFLNIQQNGFHEQHKAWVAQLKKESSEGEGESIFLLGQLYAMGLGVDKDLHHSIKLLRKASASNIPGSETERLKVEAILAKQEALAAQHKAEQARKKAAELKRQEQLAEQRRAIEAREKRKQELAREKQRREQQAMEKQKQLIADKARKRQQEEARLKTLMAEKLKQQQANQNAEAEDPRSQICSGRNRFSAGCR